MYLNSFCFIRFTYFHKRKQDIMFIRNDRDDYCKLADSLFLKIYISDYLRI